MLTEYLRSTLALDAIVLFRGYASKLTVMTGDTGGLLTDTEQAAAEWAYSRREPAGRGTGTLPGSAWFFIPLFGRETLGVLGVRTIDGRRVLEADQKRLLFAMRDQASTALERMQLAAAMEHTRLLSETDKLRAALLSSVSHDLRTPLVSIKGATTALLDLGDTLAASDKRELLENVLEETDRLNRYVQNLLDMTRLGYGAVTPQTDWRDVREMIGTARRALKRLLDERPVSISIPEGEELVFTDAALLEQMLVNLFENAAKYSPAGAPIEVEGRRGKREHELAVCDRGPGIPTAEREKVFDLFSRAGDRPADGRHRHGVVHLQGIRRSAARHDRGVGSFRRPGVLFQDTSAAAERGAARAGSYTVTAGTPRLLVVDDEPPIRKPAHQPDCRALARHGIRERRGGLEGDHRQRARSRDPRPRAARCGGGGAHTRHPRRLRGADHRCVDTRGGAAEDSGLRRRRQWLRDEAVFARRADGADSSPAA